MIVGLIPCDGGEIHIDGRSVTQMPIHRRSALGLSYLPQEASIFRKLTVQENVRAVLELQQDSHGQALPKAEVEQRLHALLEELRVDHLRDSPALALSGGTPAKGFNDYVAWVRSQGGKGAVGVPAPASVPEFLVKVIAEKYKLDLVAAPYRGSAPMMADMLGNQIAAGVASIPDFIENHKAGKLRVVAVMGTQRQAAMPEVPTFAELGLSGFEDVPYYGVFAPAGTPKATLDKLGSAIQKAIAQPDVQAKLTAMGLTVGYMTSEQLAARERSYAKVWAKIIKDSGFQPQ
jgi:tripartite-type tricarboxylate transporter receptor subunit TctC